MTTEAPLALASGLRLVSASAGSGKTYRLTEAVTNAVAPSASAPLEMEGLVGVTYTTRAHAELEARIRRVLVEKGAFDRAQELPLAYVGTVHAVCLRLVKEFALDAGLSPSVDVIPGNEGRRLLQAALEQALERSVRQRLDTLGREFQLKWDGRTGRTDWVTPVDDIMSLARGNRIPPDDLPPMAQRSVEGLMALLPPSAVSGRLLEAELATAIARAIDELSARGDDTKKTRDALQELRDAGRRLKNGDLPWSAWAKLSELEPAKRAKALVSPVHEAASAYATHPRFRARLRELTELMFEAARVGLVAYATAKAQRGVVDYVDMIDRALDVLSVPDIATELRERLQLVVVDEFQDTSPIQLALFTRLHALSGRSVWVGDRKQCIFEYAGADPALMDAVTHWAGSNGGEREILEHNYRSRPELVAPLSSLFSAAFAAHGHPLEEVVTTAKRPHSPELDRLPPIGLWWLEGQEQEALAEGVARLLKDPESTPILDASTGRARPVRPSDLAVLVYSNSHAQRVSAALEARGIATVLPRVGLLRTPEGTLVTAALRLLVDRRDTLAAAEIEALTGYARFASSGDAPGAAGTRPWELWLTEQIRGNLAKSPAPEAPAGAQPTTEAESAAPSLERLRGELGVLSPAETLDRVLSLLDLPALAIRWPEPEQRLANLDALRALATAYEARCAYQREAASLAGLLRYFEETQQVIRQRDEERATDEQHLGGSDGAIVISTYHKAKGLEWPVVILGSLGRERRRDAFEVTPESDRQGFDAEEPLGGRWIRYWPWPLGLRKSGPLADRAADSPVGKAVTERDARERVRLLYVGCTRARDHLILGIPLLKKGPSKGWLDELHDDRGALLTLPDPDAAAPCLGIRGLGAERLSLPVQAWTLAAPDTLESTEAATGPRYWYARASTDPSGAPPYKITPSRVDVETLELPPARVLGSMRFTRRMPFATPKGTSWDRVGTALHAFLAADRAALSAEERTTLASRILGQAGLGGAFEPEVAVAASDALRAFVSERWPDALWHRELPMSAMLPTAHGRRKIAGAIDLLLETPKGFVIMDHKSFPGRASDWEERALGYAPQLMTYSRAIEMAGGTVLGRFVHFTIGGGVVEIGEGAQ